MAYDLEEQESLDQLKAWWEKWGTLTMTVITAGCLAFAAYNGWHWYKRYQGNKATVAYVQLQTAFVQNDEKNIKSLADGLMQEYPNHVFAALAALMKASNDQQAGRLDDARTALNWVINEAKRPEYDAVARVRLAGVELDAKNPQKALEVLKGVAPESAGEAMVLDRMGDVHLALGEVENARADWNKAILADAEQGSLIALLTLKLQALPEPKGQ